MMKKIISFFREQFDKSLLPVFALAAAAFLFYVPVLSFDYTWLDDIYLIFSRNSELRSFSFSDLLKQDFFLTGQSSSYLFYRPLALLPWIIAAKLAGTSLWIYHLENVLFHIAASLSLFALMRRVGISEKASFVAMATFLFSVTGAAIAGFVPNLSYPMLLSFINLSFISGINFLRGKKIRFLFSHLFFFMLGMFTLETAVGFVPVFIFYALFVSSKENKSISMDSWKTAFGISALYAAVFMLWYALRKCAIGGGMPSRDFSLVLDNVPVFFSSLVNFFMPFFAKPLARASYRLFPVLPGIALTAVLAYLPFSKYVRNARIYCLGALFYLFFLAPSFMSVFEFNDMPHRLYIPSAGLLIMLSQVSWRKIIPAGAVPHFCIAVCFVSALCGGIFLRNYRNAETFWARAVKDNPGNISASRQLININYEQGNYAEAAKLAYILLQSSDGNPDARALYASNSGLAGMYGIAEENFRMLLNNYPENSSYRIAYAEFLDSSGEFEAAEKEYKKTFEKSDGYIYGHFSYGNFLFSSGRLKEAEREYREALRIFSEKPGTIAYLNDFRFSRECRENLSYVLIEEAAKSSDRIHAAEILMEAAELNPSSMVYEKSADIMMSYENYAEAEALYRLAAEANDGNSSRAAAGAGVASTRSGNLKKAAYYFNVALEKDPGNRQAKIYLEKIAAMLYRQQDGEKQKN